MEGVTNFIVRDYFAKNTSVSLVATEFVRVASLGLSQKQARREVKKHKDKPLSVQLMGNDPEQMGQAAKLVNSFEPAVIDINLGCPSSRASRSGVGAKLLQNPKLIYEIVARMRENISCLQSAKIRAGYDNTHNVLEIVRLLEKAGVDFIIVHPRRRVDFYEGKADWEIIGKVKRAVKVPVIGNGDVWSAEDATALIKQTGVDGVMLGRGALSNPFIFEQIDCLKNNQQIKKTTSEQFINYINNLVELYRAELGLADKAILGKLKELVHWLFRKDKETKRTLLRTQDFGEFCESLDEAFRRRER